MRHRRLQCELCLICDARAGHFPAFCGRALDGVRTLYGRLGYWAYGMFYLPHLRVSGLLLLFRMPYFDRRSEILLYVILPGRIHVRLVAATPSPLRSTHHTSRTGMRRPRRWGPDITEHPAIAKTGNPLLGALVFLATVRPRPSVLRCDPAYLTALQRIPRKLVQVWRGSGIPSRWRCIRMGGLPTMARSLPRPPTSANAWRTSAGRANAAYANVVRTPDGAMAYSPKVSHTTAYLSLFYVRTILHKTQFRPITRRRITIL